MITRDTYTKDAFSHHRDKNVLNLKNFEFKNVGEIKQLFKFLNDHPEIDTLISGSITLTNGNEMMEVKPKRFHSFCYHLQVNTTLTTLNLSGNNLGDDNISFLSRCIAKNKSIKNLDLSSNYMEDQGFTALMQALMNHPSIESLDIRDNIFQTYLQGYADILEKLLTKNTTLKFLYAEHGLDEHLRHIRMLQSTKCENHSMIEAIQQLSKFYKHRDVPAILNVLYRLNMPGEIKDEVIESLRNQLNTVYDSSIDHLFHDAIYHVLLALAEFRPINRNDPMTQNKIDKNDCVFSSTGHQFDIHSLIAYHNTRNYRNSPLIQEFHDGKYLLNPLTSAPFSSKDTAHIKAFAALKGIEILHLASQRRCGFFQVPALTTPKHQSITDEMQYFSPMLD